MPFKDRLLEKEIEHFNRLSSQGKKLFSMVIFYNLIAPIFSVFTNAFLWRQSQDFMIVTLFNISAYAVSPIGFFMNGLLLRKIPSPSKALFIGIMAQSLVVTSLIFFPDINYLNSVIYGMASGLGLGLFWANRSVLSLIIVNKKENRMYYSSLEQASSTLSAIVIPVLVGSFLIFGERHRLYTPNQGYYLLAVYVLFIALCIWSRVKDLEVKFHPVNQFFLKKDRGDWDKTRLFIYLNGLFGIVNFFPTLMVLKFVGNEDSLGAIQSVSAVIAAVLIYSLAKRLKNHQRLWVTTSSSIFAFLAALSFALFYSKLGVVLFFVFQAFGLPLGILGYYSVYFDSIQKESEKKQNHYAHIVDSEIFLNLGRITGIGLFILIYYFSQTFAIRYTLVFLAASQILIFWVVKSIDKKHGNFPPNPKIIPENALNPNN